MICKVPRAERRRKAPRHRRRLNGRVDSVPDQPPAPKHRGGMPVGCAERARALLEEQLRHGPKLGSQVEAAAEAAEIPKRSLVVVADALGVRMQKGLWWLPG